MDTLRAARLFVYDAVPEQDACASTPILTPQLRETPLDHVFLPTGLITAAASRAKTSRGSCWPSLSVSSKQQQVSSPTPIWTRLLAAIAAAVWHKHADTTERNFQLQWRQCQRPLWAAWSASISAHAAQRQRRRVETPQDVYDMAAAWTGDQAIELHFIVQYPQGGWLERQSSVLYTPFLYAFPAPNCSKTPGLAGLPYTRSPRAASAEQPRWSLQTIVEQWQVCAPYAAAVFPLSSAIWLRRHLTRYLSRKAPCRAWRDLQAAVPPTVLIDWMYCLSNTQRLSPYDLTAAKGYADELRLPWDALLWPLWLAIVHCPAIQKRDTRVLTRSDVDKLRWVLHGSLEQPTTNPVSEVQYGGRDVDDVFWAVSRMVLHDAGRSHLMNRSQAWTLHYPHMDTPSCHLRRSYEHVDAWSAFFRAWGCTASDIKCLHPGLVLRIIGSVPMQEWDEDSHAVIPQWIQTWSDQPESPRSTAQILLRKVFMLVARILRLLSELQQQPVSSSQSSSSPTIIDLTTSSPAAVSTPPTSPIPRGASPTSTTPKQRCSHRARSTKMPSWRVTDTVKGCIHNHASLLQSLLVLLRPTVQGQQQHDSMESLASWLSQPRYQNPFHDRTITAHSRQRQRAMFHAANHIMFRMLEAQGPGSTTAYIMCLQKLLRSRFGVPLYLDCKLWTAMLEHSSGLVLGLDFAATTMSQASQVQSAVRALHADETRPFILATMVNLTQAVPLARAKTKASSILLLPWSDMELACVWRTSCGCEFAGFEFVNLMARQTTFFVTPHTDMCALPSLEAWDRECPACSAVMVPVQQHALLSDDTDIDGLEGLDAMPPHVHSLKRFLGIAFQGTETEEQPRQRRRVLPF